MIETASQLTAGSVTSASLAVVVFGGATLDIFPVRLNITHLGSSTVTYLGRKPRNPEIVLYIHEVQIFFLFLSAAVQMELFVL